MKTALLLATALVFSGTVLACASEEEGPAKENGAPSKGDAPTDEGRSSGLRGDEGAASLSIDGTYEDLFGERYDIGRGELIHTTADGSVTTYAIDASAVVDGAQLAALALPGRSGRGPWHLLEYQGPYEDGFVRICIGTETFSRVREEGQLLSLEQSLQPSLEGCYPGIELCPEGSRLAADREACVPSSEIIDPWADEPQDDGTWSPEPLPDDIYDPWAPEPPPNPYN